MSAVRIAFTVASAAMAATRNPVVRAGIRQLANNPKARETVLKVTQDAAYNAGVVARHIMGRRLP
ncbi:hypothetical protein [Devosia sp. RR2S18]|uniref:hypothetical protein n=1 Tax=Devosia rhizosphaerae TaxID=3049774 RepID=UPI00253F9861|nr:hypothetical protein [Devosia sp. RR2S18]WIJ26253.1 hypothetical protein QOV41_05695 [Devosia sp. RR2S18]